MKHPAREEWISFIYDEMSPSEKTVLKEHLQACTECQRDFAEFEQTRAALNEWKLAPTRARSFGRGTVLKWAAAAAVVLGIGFAVGRSTTSDSREIATLRAEMKKLATRSTADANAQTVQLLAELNASWKAKFEAAQFQHDGDYASLRKELETVAVLTEASLQRAQKQIVQLAEYSQPNSPIENQH